jgi:transposase
MVNLVKKNLKGKTYLYLRHNKRVNGQAKCALQIYLGSEEDIIKYGEVRFSKEIKINTFDFGLPSALFEIIQKLNLIQIIDEATEKREQGFSVGQYMAIGILNRCIKPCSKNKILEWFHSEYLHRAIPHVETYLNADAYANHYAYLNETVMEQIETKLMAQVQQEFGVKWEELMFDPTNFSTYLNPSEEMTLPRHGHPKDGRVTLNLIGLSLVATADGGIPLLSHIYSGNQQDASVFKTEIDHILNRLAALEIDSAHLQLVFDKGNLSDDAFAKLITANLSYLCSIRPSMVKEYHDIPESAFPRFKLPNGKSVGIIEKRKDLYDAEQRIIIEYNPLQAEWNDANLRKKLDKDIVTVTTYFATRLNKRKWRNRENIEAKILKMIPPSRMIYISLGLQGEEGNYQLALEIQPIIVDKHEETLGKTYLMTSDFQTPADQLIWRYRQQYLIERCFKWLKRPDLLSVCPVHCQNDVSIRGYLFTCVLGLLVLTLLIRHIQQKYAEETLDRTYETLSQIKLSTISIPGWSGMIKQLNEMTEHAKDLFDYMNLSQYQ